MRYCSFLINITPIFDKPGIFAIVSGILIASAFPKIGFSFVIWFSLVPLLVALENASNRTAFRVGFTCGFVTYACVLYWINIVITKYGNLPWAVSIPLYLALSAWLALFYGLAAFVSCFGERVGLKKVFTLPVCWIACDFMRSFLLTGFPWAMLGHSQYRTLTLIQIADLAGVYGITFMIVLANVVCYRVIRASLGAKVPYPVKSAVVLLIALLATLLYGFYRLNGTETPAGNPMRVALVQGNIRQDIKWSPEFRDQTIAIYERLTKNVDREKKIDLIVWPESAVPFFFQDQPQEAERITALARELDSYLLFGSPTYERRNGQLVFLNSGIIIDPTGKTLAKGNKIHLVPFGEYVPMRSVFPFISKIVVGIGDFSPGEYAKPLPAGKAEVGLLVCYEAIFPELAREYVKNGANILVNITNDAWFGNSSAPYQHLSIAVFRAVETRTPLIRAANTGITAIVDQNGHIRAMTNLFEESLKIGDITTGTADSFYLKTGDIAAQFCVALTILITLLACFRLSKRTI